MSSKTRRFGRRVAGVGLLSALFVLGLEAPAQAVITITGLSPTSGPSGCIVVATGTGFRDFPAADTDVEFVNSVDSTEVETASNFFAFSSGTTLWVEAPTALDPGDSYFLRVDNPATADPGITSTATFLNTSSAGGCAPTITSFTPGCGSAGDTVTITGTNLQDSEFDGAAVFFAPYTDEATPVVPDVSDVTSLTVVVPSGTTDGQIKIINDVTNPAYDGSPVGTEPGVFSTTSFLVPPPDCAPVTGNEHARSITLKLKKSGAASGVVSSTEEEPFTACVSEVPVKFKFKPVGKSWKNAGSTTTDDQGNYSKKLKGKPGKYKAIAAKVSIGDPVTDVCLKARSPVRKIKG